MNTCARWFCILVFFAVGGGALSADPGEELFERRVRPLLIEQCGKCHGAEKQWGGLRLDRREALIAGGEQGPAIEPGHPERSLLVAAIRRDGALQMPPDEALSAEQVAAIEQWIQLGAPWPANATGSDDGRLQRQRSHWAYQPIRAAAVPVVAQADWNQNPIDAFVEQQRATHGLRGSPPADRRALIRRLTYDLTGLPPTPAAVERFVADNRPQAVERLVDELLESPAYAEHWARHWLDVARYADTKGYVYGREERFWVHAGPYRDWVVKAFQQDLPYDQFLRLQIAADQFAPDDPSAAAAMGFLTLGRRFLGVTPDIIDDRIDVVTRGTMGLTVACARCHDHKYDPIPTRDYYSLYSVFLNSREEYVPLGPIETGNEAVDQELAKRQQAFTDTYQQRCAEASDRARRKVADYFRAQLDLASVIPEGFDVILSADDLIPAYVRQFDTYLSAPARLSDPLFIPWRQLAQLPSARFSAEAATLIAQWRTADEGQINRRVLAALEPAPASLAELVERYAGLFSEIDQAWRAQLAAAEQQHVDPPTRLADDHDEAIRQFLFDPHGPCSVPAEPLVSTEGLFESAACEALWRLRGEIDRHLINQPQSPKFAVRLVDRDWQRPAFVFRRGNPKSRGDAVEPRFLSLLAPSDTTPWTHGSGRRELAEAITDPQNPLTARVWVNRVWQHHFGEGLVLTPSDFGIRAEPPSHPELLDWLATEFIRSGWRTKHLHRLIVLSRTYQQSSSGPLDAAQRIQAEQFDPGNRWLWRMPVHRLSFEELRDSWLASAGWLDQQTGGRSTGLFDPSGSGHYRRTLYCLVDRQFLPGVLRVFDFPNPDLHIPKRSETTVPQQALFAMNHPFAAHVTRGIVQRAHAEAAAAMKSTSGGNVTGSPSANLRERTAQLDALYRLLFQRVPTPTEQQRLLKFLDLPVEPEPPRPATASDWQYGWGELDHEKGQLKQFQRLPHFTGSAWQGGAEWPGGGLGWLQLTAEGGHPGNDLAHAVVRRWTAPRDGRYAIESLAIHEVEAGDGIRCHIVASRGGFLKSISLHKAQEPLSIESIDLQAGDTLDFIVDIHGNLNSDQFLWAPVIKALPSDAPTSQEPSTTWDARTDFAGPPVLRLSRWEQLTQVLLMSNEFLFVD